MENNEELFSVFDESVSDVSDSETIEQDSIIEPETEPEQETVSESPDDTKTDESVIDSTSETTETEVDSYDEFCSSCSAETLLNDSAGFYFVESSAECSSVISDNEYLQGIYQNSTYSVVFEFVIILLLVIVMFSRFLNNLIL